ncbi:phosphonate metabolism protein/1,5-bisphosphokinase (PRPP-forming) PhnN [Gemmobacter fulvus]|uniref:phosphonate metabolism protein/1,5-bisphosphokinase (PRPP-forming) PhnN n=1 Tax=Gemmobacter fulvus TaxID=2840474 RepID=UPI0027968AF3|nr:phosphonate metabolism protein/1,5-bisphosphokinase (PRPP-forming) PhnN [Gemmobacter fulvus]MDQ1849108.1 phosphonate metabolism protein/1,5-bisphosphokinase (PRPP-forming) PhnN [Gemmobacter fulvus]
MTGRLFAVVGPSGAGKDTLIAAAQAVLPDLHVVRRVISRPATAGGEVFEGVSAAAFAARREAGEFALHWQAHGLDYGIPAAALALRDHGKDVLFNGSRKALAAAQGRIAGLEVILVSAPPAVLAQRLAARGREAEADIAARLARATDPAPDGFRLHPVDNGGDLAAGLAAFLAVFQPVRA